MKVFSTIPKYSVVLPTLNGRETLSVTLPAMLRIARPDVEWIVSDNRSDDGGYDWLLKLAAADRRLRVVRPAQRLCIGEHLEFTYRFARGQWLCHIGDDDLLLPDRFEILDRLIADTRADLIRGQFLRYLWPEYPDPRAANSFDPNQQFSGDISLLTGPELARRMLNEKVVHAGGAWAIKRELIEQVRERSGWFSSPQHLEFFGMRAAAALSQRAVLVDRPLFILGRHKKSSGSLAYLPKRKIGAAHWNWNFEDPLPYRYSPFLWKAYCTLSLDGAVATKETFPEVLAHVDIDWPHWTDLIFREAAELIRIGQLPRSVRSQFFEALTKVPGADINHWRWRWMRKTLQRPLRLLKESSKPLRAGLQKRIERLRTARRPDQAIQSRNQLHTLRSWTDRILGRDVGFSDIAEAALWYSRRQAIQTQNAAA